MHYMVSRNVLCQRKLRTCLIALTWYPFNIGFREERKYTYVIGGTVWQKNRRSI